MCGVGEVVDDEPREEKLSTTSRATCRGTRTRGVGEVVDEEPRDVPRHPDAQRGRCRIRAVGRWSDRAHDESECDRPKRSRAPRRCVRMHGIVDVEPLRPGDN
jgi:hypothetical protein